MNGSRLDQARRVGLAVGLGIIAAALAFGIVFAVARGLGSWFGAEQTAVDGVVIATFAGVVGGVPVALLHAWLASREAQRQDAAERVARRAQLLRTMQVDLTENLEQLVERDRSKATVPFLRTDLWQALTGSDQLALLGDPALLGILARAYHRVGLTADLERQIWNAVHDPAHSAHRVERATGRDVSGRYIEWLVEATRDQDPHTKAAIDVALEHIARELGEAPPPNMLLPSELGPIG